MRCCSEIRDCNDIERLAKKANAVEKPTRGAQGSSRCTGHGLGPAGEHNVAVAEEDVLSAVHDGLEAAAAETVDGERGNVHWHTAAQTDVARTEGKVGRNTIK